jgi:hypothetical protein
VPGSSQVVPRHPKAIAYRCFLPDLTGFTDQRCAGPDSRRRARWWWASGADLDREFSSAVADCGYRAPLVPRLARPRTMVWERVARVNSASTTRRGDGNRVRPRFAGRDLWRGCSASGNLRAMGAHGESRAASRNLRAADNIRLAVGPSRCRAERGGPPDRPTRPANVPPAEQITSRRHRTDPRRWRSLLAVDRDARGDASAVVAERVGFEPTSGCPERHFQCRALGL